MHQVIQHFEPLHIRKAISKTDQVFHCRQEYKFIISIDLLDDILLFLKDKFFCKYCDDGFVFKYHNTYFDTPQYDFFHMHRQGKYNRLKVRIRRYQNGIPSQYVEVKEKVKGVKNKKKRKIMSNSQLPVQFLNERLSDYRYSLEDLSPSVEIAYSRLHFASKLMNSRVTIDFDLMANLPDNKAVSLIPDHFILEFKSNHYPKEIIRFLRRHHKIREQSFSKYCVALCALNKDLKRNQWKSIFKHYI